MLRQRMRSPKWRWQPLILWKEMVTIPTGMVHTISLKSVMTKHQDGIRQIMTICSARTLPKTGDARIANARLRSAQQAAEWECSQAARTAVHQKLLFQYIHKAMLFWELQVDGAIERFVPASLRELIRYLVQFPRLMGNLKEWQMYEKIPQNYYWPPMVSKVYTTDRQCRTCMLDSAQTWHQWNLQLFSLAGPMEFLAINIFGQQEKENDRNQSVTVTTNRYWKLMSAITTANMTATQNASIVLGH